LDITKELSSKQHSEADILEVMIDSGLWKDQQDIANDLITISRL
jgi:hypothetical protein